MPFSRCSIPSVLWVDITMTAVLSDKVLAFVCTELWLWFSSAGRRLWERLLAEASPLLRLLLGYKYESPFHDLLPGLKDTSPFRNHRRRLDRRGHSRASVLSPSSFFSVSR